MFALLAEDPSDAEALVALVRRIQDQGNPRILRKGFSGCGELCRKAASYVELFGRQGATHFLICHDADGPDPAPVRSKVQQALKPRITIPIKFHAIIVPVQELEAWFIADPAAIQAVIPSLRIPEVRQPETIPSPKEWLETRSRKDRSRPLYAHATFNPRVAAHLDIALVERKCPSFRELAEFVRESAR
jgi:hypothetical protein